MLACCLRHNLDRCLQLKGMSTSVIVSCYFTIMAFYYARVYIAKYRLLCYIHLTVDLFTTYYYYYPLISLLCKPANSTLVHKDIMERKWALLSSREVSVGKGRRQLLPESQLTLLDVLTVRSCFFTHTHSLLDWYRNCKNLRRRQPTPGWFMLEWMQFFPRAKIHHHHELTWRQKQSML